MAKSNHRAYDRSRAYDRGYADAANGVYKNIYNSSSMEHFYYLQGQADYEENSEK